MNGTRFTNVRSAIQRYLYTAQGLRIPMNDDSYSGNNSGLSSFHPTFCLRGMDSFNIKIY